MTILAKMTLAALLLTAAAPAGEALQAPLTPGKDGVTRPQLLSEPLPVYPRGAERESLGAILRMGFVVDATGSVRDVSSLDIRGAQDDLDPRVAADFERAARKALLARRYAPAMRKGVPVPVRLEITFDFRPEERQAMSRWLSIEAGLQALAAADIIKPGDAVAGKDGVSIPVATRQVAPVQPHGARLRGLRSRVTLLVRISSEGRVLEIPLVRAEESSQPFDDAAAAAVLRWRFKPAEKDGRAVTAWHWIRLTVPMDGGGQRR